MTTNTSEPAAARPGADAAAAWIDLAYGGLPPPPDACARTLLHEAVPARLPQARLQTWRLQAGSDGQVAWAVQVLRPAGPARVPVVVSGDACWAYLDDGVRADALARGIGLAWFNRVEVAEDPPVPAGATLADRRRALCRSALYRRHPGAAFGALAAWAWALQRVVDLLTGQGLAAGDAGPLDGIDPARVGLSGHSRGGKAALLAGALDPRVLLTAVHHSGTLGAASHQVQDEGSESLAALVQAYPHWVGAGLAEALARGDVLPADQHALGAQVAPRHLLVVQALDDAWANPGGTQRTVERLREAARRRGLDGVVHTAWRTGGHAQQPADWRAVFDLLGRLPPG